MDEIRDDIIAKINIFHENVGNLGITPDNELDYLVLFIQWAEYFETDIWAGHCINCGAKCDYC